MDKSLFIDGKIENGLNIDWKAVKKIYDSLGVPDGFYKIPWGAIRGGNKYMITLSQRSTGKTTNVILLGLCMSKWSDWKIQIAYIRPSEGEIAQSHAERLTEVINSYNNGHYIKTLTDGKYNCLVWHWRQFYFALRGEDGKIVDRAEKSVIQCLSVEREIDYKSTLNMPYGDLIIYDEFIGQRYRPNEAILFFDLTKTIIRGRMSPIIFMCANTISVTSQYFEELEISREVKRLQLGEKKEVVTERGTRIYIELVDPKSLSKTDSKIGIINSLFYGFKNPKLASITGGELFAFESVPHILPKMDSDREIVKNLYIETVGELLQLEFKYNDVLGYHIEVHRATRTYDDSIILSVKHETDTRYKFGFGADNIESIITTAIRKQNIYFSSNEVGAIFYDYINRVYAERRRY